MGSTSGLHPWRLRSAARRARTQWRLLLVVTAVAVLACTLVSTLTLLVWATEQRGVRAAFDATTAQDAEITVRLTTLTTEVEQARSAVDPAVARLVGSAGPVTGTGLALSALYTLARPSGLPAITYLGDLDDVEQHAVLDEGSWPTTTAGADGTIPVALPRQGARVLGLGVGDTLTIRPYFGLAERQAEVIGLYTADAGGPVGEAAERYWRADLLTGTGHDPAFVVPQTAGSVTTDAVGPLLLAPGGLDALGVPAERLAVRYSPDLTQTTVADVAPLIERLGSADVDLPADIGAVAENVRSVTRLQPVAQEIGSALVVTRATVVVVSLLLLVLAVAALLQTARLLAEARTGEQHLMRARGASGRQLLSLTAVEALVLVALTAALSPFLARWAYRLVAGQPAMAAAGMSVDPGTPVVTWATAGGVAVVLGVVLVSPLLRRGGTFVEGEQVRARPSRRSTLQRSGLDVVLLLLAGVAYWQLRSYRSPLGGGTSLRIDPVLVAGPALALLAGGLVCVRLAPATSWLTERIGAHSRGVVLPLAAWEVARRTHRATAAVLLLTLALAVGTFSQSFLSTWRLSQADQATFQLGAPVQVADVDDATLQQAVRLGGGADGVPQPVLRREGGLTTPDAATSGTSDGTRAEVLGLPAAARAMLDRGRLADEGGRAVADLLDGEVAPVLGVPLPGSPRGISAVLQAGQAGTTMPGVTAIQRAVLEDANGLITTVDLGTVPVDGTPHDAVAMLPATDLSAPLRLVGVQSVIVADPRLSNGAVPGVTVTLRDLAVLEPAPDAPAGADADPGADPGAQADTDTDASQYVATPLAVGDVGEWFALAQGGVPLSTTPPEGWQIGLRISLPAGLERHPATVVQIGWPAVTNLPVVLTTHLADRLNVSAGDQLALLLDGSVTKVVVAGTTRHVPSTTAQDVVVVDQVMLGRALAQSGAAPAAVDEWWVDVAPEHVAAYLAGLPTDDDGRPAADRARSQVELTRQMQQHPLRVATQGALWLVTLAAAGLAAIGFAVHAAVTLRAREVELAQLRAIGLARRRLTAVVGTQSLLVCLLGTVFGVGLGALLGWLVGPLVAVSADGSPPVPSVRVLLPWTGIGMLAAEVVALLALVVLAVGRMQRTADPASVLRLGDQR